MDLGLESQIPFHFLIVFYYKNNINFNLLVFIKLININQIN